MQSSNLDADTLEILRAVRPPALSNAPFDDKRQTWALYAVRHVPTQRTYIGFATSLDAAVALWRTRLARLRPVLTDTGKLNAAFRATYTERKDFEFVVLRHYPKGTRRDVPLEHAEKMRETLRKVGPYACLNCSRSAADRQHWMASVRDHEERNRRFEHYGSVNAVRKAAHATLRKKHRVARQGKFDPVSLAAEVTAPSINMPANDGSASTLALRYHARQLEYAKLKPVLPVKAGEDTTPEFITVPAGQPLTPEQQYLKDHGFDVRIEQPQEDDGNA